MRTNEQHAINQEKQLRKALRKLELKQDIAQVRTNYNSYERAVELRIKLRKPVGVDNG